MEERTIIEDKPVTLVISQWQRDPKPNSFYLIYRWTIAIMFLVTLVLAMLDLKQPEASLSYRVKWLIYATNWGYVLCTLQALVGALLLTRDLLKPHLEVISLNFYKFYWITNTVATDFAFAVTAFYWSIVHDGKVDELDALNFLTHVNNSILMVLDMFVVAHCFRLVHCWYSILFAVCYALFNCIYAVAGGLNRKEQPYIYEVLDWTRPGKSVGVCVGVITFIMIMHVVACGLCRFRLWIYSKCHADRTKGHIYNHMY